MTTQFDHVAAGNPVDDQADIEREEMYGFSRTLASIHWLLAILVMLYLKMPGSEVLNETLVIAALIVYSLYVIVFHYLWRSQAQQKWNLALHAWVMIAFVTFAAWQTGRIASPLVSLYFLPIIASALALGLADTLLEVGLVSACCLLLSFSTDGGEIVFEHITTPLMQLFPFWLVAYLAAMLARDRGRARSKIQHLSQTDYLTGMWNMRTFFTLLQKELDRSGRYKRSFSILMLDADNLKPVNDTYGHDAGSAMIKLVAVAIQETVRSSDIAARFGGDEFVVLLPETRAEKVLAAGERIRRAIEDAPLAVSGGVVHVTASIGAAGFPDHGDSMQELMRKADMALYHSKHSGKNCVSVYDDGMQDSG